MKYLAAAHPDLIHDNLPTSPDPKPASEVEAFSYAKELRALGQALEKQNFSSVDLEIEEGIYVVRGKATASREARSSFSRFIRDLICGANSHLTNKNGMHDMDLRYSPEEIERFESAGQAKRIASNKMPDPYSLSQILRGAGSFLDHRKETSLVGITIKDRWVTVRYETAEGRLEQAKQDLFYFYDYWVKMYLRRSSRPKAPPPTDPTLIVSWNGIEKRLT